MILTHVKISYLKGKNVKIDLNDKQFFVTMKGGQVENISHWYVPHTSAFKTEEEYIEATSIDAKTFFVVKELVDSFVGATEGLKGVDI
jgi:hypothetical protein